MKKIVCAALSLLISFNLLTPLASGLYITYFEKSIPLSQNLRYTSYIGEDSASYSQSVHILDLDPSGDTLPIAAFGKAQLSHKTLKSMMETENQKSGNVIAGINGDFYSLQTGIPLSAVIREGIILSTDSGNNAVGFRDDGTVVIGKPEIKMTLSFELKPVEEEPAEEVPTEEIPTEEIPTGETPTEEIPTEEISAEEMPAEETAEVLEATVENTDEISETFEFSVHYNKYPTVYAVYMTDSSYSSNTSSKFPSREIVVKTHGELTLNSETVLEVLEVFAEASNTSIPDGAMVLTIPDVLRNSDKFSGLEKGDTLKLNITCAEGWETVRDAIGGGDVIVQNGEFVPETVNEDHEKYRNARSAVGVRDDGSVIFVAVDGDGKIGAGMTFERLSEFMIGEGAVTVLNLDGGGSTTVAVRFPSDEEIEVLNIPKDGSERRVSNSILLLNRSQNTNLPAFADFSTSDAFILGGTAYTPIPEFYNGQGANISATPASAEITNTDADAVIEDGVYISADKSYIDRLFVTFDFGDLKLDGEAVINVTDKIDTLYLNKNNVILDSGESFRLTATANRFGIPVTTPVDALTYTDLAVKGENAEPSVITEETQPVTEYLFENEYLSLSKDGILTAKEAPLFTRVDLSVSYKDTSSVLSVYFGKPDEVLDTFDGESWSAKIANSDKMFASSGYRSEKSVFVSDGILAYNTPQVLDIIPSYFTLWIKGEYKGDLSVVVQNGDKQLFVPYFQYKNYSDVSGWIQLIAPIPENLENGITVLCPAVSTSQSAFTVDTFAVHYGYTTDPFEDIGGIWSHDYIMQIYDMGIINGYLEDGRLIFKPENNITRAEFAKMLASYLSLDTKKYADYGTAFADAEDIAEWSSEYIKALSNEGYMNGKSNPDGTVTFDSKSFITREEAMHVFAKLLKEAEDEYVLEFSDSESVQSWALDSVKRVVSAGIVTGFDDGTIRASSPVTRGQMCTMFTRLWSINK